MASVQLSFTLPSSLSATFSPPPAPKPSSTALSHPSTEVSVENCNQLDQEYVFVYVNPKEVSNKVLVKCLVMNEKLLIDALKEGFSNPAHLEICVRDYTIANESSNYSEQSAVEKTRTEKQREENTERCGLQNWGLGF
ncbi:probable proteasome inhibitor [Arachis duranensis]|uniref:Probable proteasome inhibitor n=1 Tax=Arachis duranensis TaxID=130453 RepID=A0A9C6WQP6_ARADU|nr:probable proteasome inhibitor [Arachis duranensis]